jgi:hypothetical protein
MIKLKVNEIAYIFKVISEQDIKGADAPFIANILGKLTNEANRIQKEIKPTPKVE